MDTDNDTGDAFVDIDSLMSLIEKEINHRDRVNNYGKNYYFGRQAMEKRNENKSAA